MTVTWICTSRSKYVSFFLFASSSDGFSCDFWTHKPRVKKVNLLSHDQLQILEIDDYHLHAVRKKKWPSCLQSTFWQILNLSVCRKKKKKDFSENQSQHCHSSQAKNKTENFSIHTFPSGVTPLGCCNSAGLMFFRLHNNDNNLPLCWIEPTVHLLKVSTFTASSLEGGDILFPYSARKKI